MKRIVLVVIFVIMLFTSCEEPSAEQNVYEENFDGITFGMTKEEVITVLGRDPDSEFDSENKDEYNIGYYRQIFLDVTANYVYYSFDENGNLCFIFASYTYFDESEKEQMSIDLDHVKEELSKYYPENTLTRINERDNALSLFTESRLIWLATRDDGSFYVTIMVG